MATVYRLWSSTSKIPRWNYAILTLVLGGFGILMLVNSTIKELKARHATQWPQTGGIVISSSPAVEAHRRISWRYHPKVVFSYEVNGSSYEGQFTDYTRSYSDESAASAAYRKGEHLTVRYAPQHPSEWHVPGMDGSTQAGGIALGTFLLAVAVFTFVRWRECLRASR